MIDIDEQQSDNIYKKKLVQTHQYITLTFLNPNLSIKARKDVLDVDFNSDHFAVVIAIKGEVEENIVYKSR
jgi:hypothetical protein